MKSPSVSYRWMTFRCVLTGECESHHYLILQSVHTHDLMNPSNPPCSQSRWELGLWQCILRDTFIQARASSVFCTNQYLVQMMQSNLETIEDLSSREGLNTWTSYKVQRGLTEHTGVGNVAWRPRKLLTPGLEPASLLCFYCQCWKRTSVADLGPRGPHRPAANEAAIMISAWIKLKFSD